ncbi:hypothetical protein [Microcoleus sp. N3A4]|uniref:hypothetical protein n=1 Tax=Microcoleus sp. N3A4 TaxID=3055379 RepID=UPI002FCF6F79
MTPNTNPNAIVKHHFIINQTTFQILERTWEVLSLGSVDDDFSFTILLLILLPSLKSQLDGNFFVDF